MASGQRYYLACKVDEMSGKNNIIGIFSNQKNMVDSIESSCISLEGAYIIGSRKNKEVTNASISAALQNNINLTIMKDNEPFIKILIIYMNDLNPLYKRN